MVFTPKVPNAEMMLARWGIPRVVIDAGVNDDDSPHGILFARITDAVRQHV